jgi:1-deoxy-D-xylulose-5-phosphate synthase
VLRDGSDGVIVALGTMVIPALEAAAELEKQHGIRLTVVNARFVKPLDSALIIELAGKHGTLITIEENALQGGFGTAVLELLEEHGLSGTSVLRLGYPDSYIPQGEQHELRSMLGLDPAGISASIRSFLSHS